MLQKNCTVKLKQDKMWDLERMNVCVCEEYTYLCEIMIVFYKVKVMLCSDIEAVFVTV